MIRLENDLKSFSEIGVVVAIQVHLCSKNLKIDVKTDQEIFILIPFMDKSGKKMGIILVITPTVPKK